LFPSRVYFIANVICAFSLSKRKSATYSPVHQKLLPYIKTLWW